MREQIHPNNAVESEISVAVPRNFGHIPRPSEGPDATLFNRERGQHVFISWARRWAKAAMSLTRDLEGYRWTIPGDIQPGDILVTVLDCKPRLVACIERVESLTASKALVDPRFNIFNPITLANAEQEAGIEVPRTSGQLADHDADRLLDAQIGRAHV